MRIIIVLLIAINVSANAQKNYNVGDTIMVDNELTLVVTDSDNAWLTDKKKLNIQYSSINTEIPDYSIGILDASGFTPPLSAEIAKTMMQICTEVFTKEELHNFLTHTYKHAGFSFWLTVNLKGEILALRMPLAIYNPVIDAIPKEKAGKLFKLIIARIKFNNMRDTGLGGIHTLNLRVPFKDLIDGTLDFSNLMRDINKGGYMNYYWKDGKLYNFE